MQRSNTHRTRTPLVWIVGGLFAAIAVVYTVFPETIPAKANPGPSDLVFGDPLVVAIVRAGAIAFVIYQVISMVVGGSKGRWITAFGPVQTGVVEKSSSNQVFWETRYYKAKMEIEELRRKLDESARQHAATLDALYEAWPTQDISVEKKV